MEKVKCKNKLTLVKQECKCEACGNPTFKQTLLIRKMSALVAPNGQETIIPMQVFACDKCGHVNKEFSDINGIQ
tara:strand:+ start:523 stop:744 length:222 start_codon:yes stop_codon:yes gene_type:complete